MIPFDYVPLVASDHYEDLRRQTAESRMINQSIKGDQLVWNRAYSYLARIGRRIAIFGYTLIGRCTEQLRQGMTFSEQGRSEGCA
jgi:hypothetical protein